MDAAVGRRQGRGAGPEWHISPAYVRRGAVYAQVDARRMLESALLLFGKKRFRGAIRLAILSIEESLKGVSLRVAAGEQRALTDEDWRRLMDHWHKLVDIPVMMAAGAERDVAVGARTHVVREVWEASTGRQAIARVCTVGNARLVQGLVSNLQRVKEMCTYEECDLGRSMQGTWGMDDAESESVAALVLELARVHCEMLRGGTAFALGTLAPKSPEPEDGGREPGPGTGKPRAARMCAGEAALLRLGGGIGARAAADDRGEDPGSV